MDSLSEFLDSLKKHRVIKLPRRKENRWQLFQRMRRGSAVISRETYFELLRWQRPAVRFIHVAILVTEGTVTRMLWMDQDGRTFARELNATERLRLARRLNLEDLLWRLSLGKIRRA